MSSHRYRRLVVVVTSALLAVMVVAPSGVSGAETRNLYVGDPAQVNTPPDPYEVHPTPVSPGQSTYFDVQIKNKGKQTLTSAAIGMGTLIADNSGSPGPQLPAGWSIKNITAQSGTVPTCVTAPASAAPTTSLITPGEYTGFSCSFGNLTKSNPGGTIRVFLTAGPALSDSSAIVVSGKVAEAVGGNVGSNSNTFFAYGAGTFFVSGDGKIAGLFTSQKVTPAVHSGRETSIDLSGVTGDFVVSIDETSEGPSCVPVGVTCIGGASTANVNLGAAVSPYFVWTILFPVDAEYKLSRSTGFIHFLDNGTFETFYNVTQTSCQKPKSKIPCADFSLLTDPSTGESSFVQVVFQTNVNGSGKLF